ncbi:hypothetical protein AHAS_Ahas11G0184500 [Arachis hypogaea]
MFKPTKKGNNNNNKNKVKVKNSCLASSPSPLPPRRAGCFWCSPNKDSRKKSKEVDWSVLGWDKDDKLLSDLGSFSSKKQHKILKALKKILVTHYRVREDSNSIPRHNTIQSHFGI